MPGEDLTTNLFDRLKEIKPVSVGGKVPGMQEVKPLLHAFKDANNADQKWQTTAPKNVISRLESALLLMGILLLKNSFKKCN